MCFASTAWRHHGYHDSVVSDSHPPQTASVPEESATPRTPILVRLLFLVALAFTLIGVIESLSGYLIGPVYKDIVVYSLFLCFLWFRPQGLMGKM